MGIVSWLKKLCAIVFAIGLLAVAVNMFMGPHNIAAGGLTGLAIILESWVDNIDRAQIVYAGNAIVIVCAFVFLGREVGVNTIIGAGLLPVMIDVVPRHTLVEDRMLAMIVGSVIFGVAVCILYKNNASSGGTAVPPLILKKYIGLKPSVGMFLTDGMVVGLSLFVFDVDSFFFAALSIFITMVVMNWIETGMTKRKRVQIISDMHREIVADISRELGRSVTLIPTTGSFKGEEKPMLMILMDSSDYKKLVEIVDRHDRAAFMVTDVVSDVHGRGFTYDSGSV